MPGIISPDRHVLAEPQARAGQGRAGAGRPCRRASGLRRPTRGRPCFSKQGQDVGDRADVVRADGQLHAALARPAAASASTSRSAIRSKQASVSRFSVQTGTGQPICSALIDLVVPVGALDQPHGHLPAGALRPGDDPLGVVRRRCADRTAGPVRRGSRSPRSSARTAPASGPSGRTAPCRSSPARCACAAASRIGRSASVSAPSEPSKSIGSVRAQSELILIDTLVRGIGPRWSVSSSGLAGHWRTGAGRVSIRSR